MTLYTVTSEIFTENKNSYIKCKNDSKFITFLTSVMSYLIRGINFYMTITRYIIIRYVYRCNIQLYF